MTKKIFRSTFLVAAVMVLLCISVVMGVMYARYSDLLSRQLSDELSMAAVGTEHYGRDFLEKMRSQPLRLTWVAADGNVIYDTHVDAATLGNHADREEIRQALEGGTGKSTRQSDTLMEKTLYQAKKLSDGTVLRISASQTSVTAVLLENIWLILAVLLVAIVLSALLARRVAKKIVKPLNRLDLEQPLRDGVYEEVEPLLRRIHQQNRQIAQQMQSLKQKAEEFAQITGNMREGMILLDSACTVQNINPAAQALYPGETVQGRDLLLIDRRQSLRDAVNSALDRGHGTFHTRRSDRTYQYDLSRIASDGQIMGVVVLIVDITETVDAQRTRREFSANVSHELKTPLQSIIGAAELLEQGLVLPEDTPRFVGNIRREAARLVSLIEDIIRISQLDEGIELPKEPVALKQLCRDVAQTLEQTAREKDVTVTVAGEESLVDGVPRLLHELVYNLCENAIKYNVPGGSVEVTVSGKTLRVADTGIGIPAEHQSRIFERFYRVDKSHSRQSGGTGLGLSIVKHAAEYHGAKLTLESTPGAGTVITVIFP